MIDTEVLLVFIVSKQVRGLEETLKTFLECQGCMFVHVYKEVPIMPSIPVY